MWVVMCGNEFWGDLILHDDKMTTVLDEAQIWDDLGIAEELAEDANEVRHPDAPMFVVVSLDELKRRNQG